MHHCHRGERGNEREVNGAGIIERPSGEGLRRKLILSFFDNFLLFLFGWLSALDCQPGDILEYRDE